MKVSTEQKVRAAKQFIAWVHRFSPEWYAEIMARVPESPPAAGLSGLGESWGLGADTWPVETSTSSSGDSWMDWANKITDVASNVVTKAIPAIYSAKQTIAVADVNLERAKQGLPPLDPQATAAQINVTHTLPPEVETGIIEWKNAAMKWGLWALIGVGGFFLIRRML